MSTTRRHWQKAILSGRFRAPSISPSLGRRVFYGGSFFYASFLAHTLFVATPLGEPLAARAVEVAAVSTSAASSEPGILEPVVARFLRGPAPAIEVSLVTSGGGAR